MSDDPKNDPPKVDPDPPKADPDPEQVEKEFWEKMKGHMATLLDERDAKKAKTPAPEPGSGTSRTGARRVTLSTLISDIVFGPPKD